MAIANVCPLPKSKNCCVKVTVSSVSRLSTYYYYSFSLCIRITTTTTTTTSTSATIIAATI